MNLEWYIARRLLKGDATRSVSVPIVKIAIVGIALGLSVMLLSLFITTGFKRAGRASFGEWTRWLRN